MFAWLAAQCGNITWDFGFSTYLINWKNAEGKTVFAFSYYELCLCLGVILGVLLVFDRLAKKRGLSSEAVKWYSVLGLVSVVIGLYSAQLFQSVYNWIENGFRDFKFMGMTFMGGLIGGVAVFLLGLNTVVPKKLREEFWLVAEIAPAVITCAHGFGRIGCFMGGCCYGRETDAWYGVVFPDVKPYGQARVPTQLFEAMFLFALCLILVVRNIRQKNGNLAIYCVAYGIWRFVLEFFRDDPRGQLVGFMTPSQFWCMLQAIIGTLLILLAHFRQTRPALKKIIPIMFAPEKPLRAKAEESSYEGKTEEEMRAEVEELLLEVKDILAEAGEDTPKEPDDEE